MSAGQGDAGFHQRIEEKDAEIASLKARVEEAECREKRALSIIGKDDAKMTALANAGAVKPLEGVIKHERKRRREEEAFANKMIDRAVSAELERDVLRLKLEAANAGSEEREAVWIAVGVCSHEHLIELVEAHYVAFRAGQGEPSGNPGELGAVIEGMARVAGELREEREGGEKGGGE